MDDDEILLRDAEMGRPFHAAWRANETAGLCDGAGGAQYQRALTAYRRAGCPELPRVWLSGWLARDNVSYYALDVGDPLLVRLIKACRGG